MKKAPLYSRSRRVPDPAEPTPAADPQPAAAVAAATVPAGRWQRLKARAARHERALWALMLMALIGGAFAWRGAPPKAPLTFDQIDHLVRKSIEEKPLPSAVSKAYEKVLPSVVRVVGLMNPEDEGDTPIKPGDAKAPDKSFEKGLDKAKPGDKSTDRPAEKADAGKDAKPMERGVGTGVVIIDDGTILTNLHVVLGAHRIKVTFADGLESEARLISVMPEHDLAVLRAQKIPDDLFAATMRSTGDLQPGDHVLAVGFPFGIGPSASAGVVSGLKREFRSPEGERVLTNLIQFDAAANPGNSGGPLVTMDGEVVGIVTAILNPTKQRVFVGIGFAVPIENAAAGAGMPPF
jgi:serine protease DegQ